MDEYTYRCERCSTRTSAVVIPSSERAEHDSWHLKHDD